MESNNGGNVEDLTTNPLDLARHFTGSGVRVPVEIVEASGESVVLGDDGVREDQNESMEIVVEEMSTNDGENLTMGVDDNVKVTQNSNIVMPSQQPMVVSSVDSTQLTPSKHSTLSSITAGLVQDTSSLPVRQTTHTTGNIPTLGISLDGTSLDPQLSIQQVSQSAIQHFQEVSRSLRNEGIEISPETIANHFPPSLAESLAASIISHSTGTNNTSLLDSAINQTGQTLPLVNYNDLSDVSRVMSNIDPNLTTTSNTSISRMETSRMENVLNETDLPSSPESNFDTNDLLNTGLGHEDEITSKLANAGPVGVAAAAAILSGRKRKKHVFESNPALRKRHCSKLMRRLKETLDELSTRVGLQACVVTYRPSSKQEKPEPAFKVFGTSPLKTSVEEQRHRIVTLMEYQLKKQVPKTQSKQCLFELPALVFEGIPTPIQEMTQAQLRAFIPHMLKYSTGRGKPGWGKDEMKPVWWPLDVPWQNIRSDVRNDIQKKTLSWSDCLRKIVLSCYIHHNRTDLLPASCNVDKDNSIELIQNDESSQQLQLLQQQGLDLTGLHHNGGGHGVATLAEVASAQVDQSLLTDQQQVFTIDTGMGNCDTAGMPTLADASLAETAARLQQVADETGQVQYATQTVTVTEGDAKALGQPVGSTTTVLLTAYPSTHINTSDTPQYYNPPSVTSTISSGSTPSVQVVYSASHVSELPDSIVSNITTTVQQQQDELYTQQQQQQQQQTFDKQVSGNPITNEEITVTQESITDSNDYLTTPTNNNNVSEVMVSTTDDNHDITSSTEGVMDLASQYISDYTSRGDSGILVSNSEQELNNELTTSHSGNIDEGISLELTSTSQGVSMGMESLTSTSQGVSMGMESLTSTSQAIGMGVGPPTSQYVQSVGLGMGLLTSTSQSVGLGMGPLTSTSHTIGLGMGPLTSTSQTVGLGMGPLTSTSQTVGLGMGPLTSTSQTVGLGMGPVTSTSQSVDLSSSNE